MTKFYLQLQVDRLAANLEERIVYAFRAAVPTSSVASGEDSGRYVNISFAADSVSSGWEAVSTVFAMSGIGPAASRASIVTCEGKHGWNDYLLLHHYDRTLITDTVSAVGAA